MAGGEEPPDNSNPQKFYKCHPKQSVSLIVCVICENAYHPRDFKKIENSIILSNVLGICPEHSDLDLTSKVSSKELSHDVRKIIAQIKNKKNEELREEILQEMKNKTQESLLNITFQDEDAECELLKKENALLKMLNDELKEKNDLLRESISNLKENTTNKFTYAQVLNNKPLPKKKRIPKITITNTNETVKNKVATCLIKNKSIQTKNVIIKDKIITIKNIDEYNALQTEKILQEELKNEKVKIQIEEFSNPKIKVVGIYDMESINKDEIAQDINMRNYPQNIGECKALHSYTNNNKTTIILEISPEIYKDIREKNNHVFVGYQSCKVYDVINTIPCIKCGRYGHNFRKCKNDITCLKCAENHQTAHCKSSIIKCANCEYVNNMFGKNLDIKHYAFDNQKCSLLKKKIDNAINQINYPMEPYIPTTTENMIISNKNEKTTLPSLNSDSLTKVNETSKNASSAT